MKHLKFTESLSLSLYTVPDNRFVACAALCMVLVVTSLCLVSLVCVVDPL